MGFKYWIEAVGIIIFFSGVIFTSSFFMAMYGSKMFNDMGNFPTKAAEIQLKAFWKFFIIEIVTLILLVLFFHFFN